MLVADDHELAREALLSVLAREPDLAVVGEARDGPEAVALARRLRPDLVLMDLRMPGLDGLQATRAVVEAVPGVKVVVLSSFETRALVLEALRAGAAGYLLKGATKAEVLTTLRDVLGGAVRVQPDLAARLLHEEAEQGGAGRRAAPPAALTARELEVLRLVAGGRSNDEIGAALHLTRNTVKTHVARLLRKLDAADRAQAVARAAARGLLGAPPGAAGPRPETARGAPGGGNRPTG